MKKDIFNGKIKKEYYSYILGYMIFFLLLFVCMGSLCLYVSIWGTTGKSPGGRLFFATLAGIAFIFAVLYLFLELLVIRRFPKYEKIRRILFNSDVYFTDSNSTEYYGIRRKRDKAAFALVTGIAEAEKEMGDKKPVRYTVYSVLALFMSILGIADFIAMPLLFESGMIWPKMSDGVFAIFYITGGVVCVVLAVFFFRRALMVAGWTPFENDKWKYILYTTLTDLAVRKNNKKRKYWYKTEQLKEIENAVSAASENAKLKIQEKKGKPISFEVMDTLHGCVVFTGFFI